MKTSDLIEKLKYAGAAIIVLAAVCIMLPGIAQYVMGLSRLLMWVAIVIAVASGLAYLSIRFSGRGKSSAKDDSSSSIAIFFNLGVAAACTFAVSPVVAQENFLQGEATKFVVIPAGATFEGRIDKTIGSSASHPGEAFRIVLASPVLANGQDVIIPAGSQVLGEVVEAIPSRTFPHPKHTPPVTGKLRTQLTELRTPDGASYPLVASLAGEIINTKSGPAQIPGFGAAKGYMGSPQALDNAGQNKKRNRSPYSQGGEDGVSSANLSDRTRAGAYSPGVLAGDSDENKAMRSGTIRSLVKRNGDLFIFNGSPLTVILNAPFKIAMNRQAADIPMGNMTSPSSSAGGHFYPSGAQEQPRSPVPPSSQSASPMPPLDQRQINAIVGAPREAPAQAPGNSGITSGAEPQLKAMSMPGITETSISPSGEQTSKAVNETVKQTTTTQETVKQPADNF